MVSLSTQIKYMQKKRGIIQTTINLREDVIDRLNGYTAINNITRTKVIEIAITEYLDRKIAEQLLKKKK